MALTEASLSSKIQQYLQDEKGSAADTTRLKEFADAIAKAVVEEIQQNAEVTVTGVQTGGSNASGTIN